MGPCHLLTWNLAAAPVKDPPEVLCPEEDEGMTWHSYIHHSGKGLEVSLYQGRWKRKRGLPGPALHTFHPLACHPIRHPH